MLDIGRCERSERDSLLRISQCRCCLKHGAGLGGRGRGGRRSGSGGSTSGDDDEAEDGLGENVEGGVREGLLVGGKAVVALGHEPNNGVGDPGDDSEVGDLVVSGAGGGGAGALAGVELLEDREEHEHAKAPEVVLLLALEESTDETGNNHEDVNANHEVLGVGGGASKAEEVEELEGGGEEPVNVAAVEELAAIEGTDVDAVAGGHGEVGEGSNGGDAEGDDVVLALAILLGHGLLPEVGGGDGEAEEGHPEELLAHVGERGAGIVGSSRGLATGGGDHGEDGEDDGSAEHV